jgi:hypothetical protein
MQGQVPRPRDAPDRPRSATPNLQGHARQASLDSDDGAPRPASSHGKTLSIGESGSRARTVSNASASKADGVQYVTLSGRTSPNLSPLGSRKGTRRKSLVPGRDLDSLSLNTSQPRAPPSSRIHATSATRNKSRNAWQLSPKSPNGPTLPPSFRGFTKHFKPHPPHHSPTSHIN